MINLSRNEMFGVETRYIIISYLMNFCQKHQHHHCVHAHGCKDPTHQKHIEKKSMSKLNKTGGTIHEGIGSRQTCHFLKNGDSKHAKQVSNQLLKQLHEKQLKICELSQAQTSSNQQIDKLSQQNKHLYSQIEYYRQQFASMIENSSQDSKNQIKKRVKESTNLILKINSLQSENQALINENERLKRQIESEKANKTYSRQLNECMEEKFNDVHNKLRVTDKQKEEYRDQMQAKLREYDRLKENYDILKKQFNFDCEKSKKIIKELTSELEQTKRDLNKLKNSSEKEKELFELEIANQQKREVTYKEKLSNFEVNNKELFDNIKQLKEKNQELEDDLYHAKKIIDKNQENTHQYISLQKELNEKNVSTNTIIKDHRQTFSASKESNKENKPKEDQTQSVEKLHEQIKSLKEKISELQKRSTANYEEIILNMGASQAFRKLLQQKNTVIKKLMRQKGEIYAKMASLHPQ